MRKTSIIMLLLITATIMTAGCGNKTIEPDYQDNNPTPALTETASSTASPEPSGTQEVSSVTQEDLDKLKAAIESIDTEDLEPLSE